MVNFLNQMSESGNCSAIAFCIEKNGQIIQMVIAKQVLLLAESCKASLSTTTQPTTTNVHNSEPPQTFELTPKL